VPLGRPGQPRRSRSSWLPWIALALVPVFFVAGFGLVSALADDGEPEAQVAPAASTAVAAASSTTAGTGSTAPSPTVETAGTTTAETGAESTTTAPAQTGQEGPRANSEAIEIDYGRWAGVFEVTGATLVPSLQTSTVGGQFTYLGGANCPVRNVVVEGRFYDEEQVPVGLANWESAWVTGEGGLERGRPVPFGAHGSVLHLATSAELRIVRVVCA
jgi:hypothetical protein